MTWFHEEYDGWWLFAFSAFLMLKIMEFTMVVEVYEENVYVQEEQRYAEEGEEFEKDERRVYEDEDERITYADKENEEVDKDVRKFGF